MPENQKIGILQISSEMSFNEGENIMLLCENGQDIT